jgi:hypothetical protein
LRWHCGPIRSNAIVEADLQVRLHHVSLDPRTAGIKSSSRATPLVVPRINRRFWTVFAGAFFADIFGMAPAHRRQSNRIEVLIGRSAAICVHPLAAWRTTSTSDRAVLLISYFAISYAIVLGLLRVLSA